MEYQPKTGQQCTCRKGIDRDNCSKCECTGWVIDFVKIRAQKLERKKQDEMQD